MASLNIFQIRTDVSDPDEIIEDRGSLWSRDVRIDGRLFGVLYVRRSKPRKPRWLPYFENLVAFAGAGALTASAAAVLLVKRKTRLYAVTFGYGRSLLADGAVEERFGLKATLNANRAHANQVNRSQETGSGFQTHARAGEQGVWPSVLRFRRRA